MTNSKSFQRQYRAFEDRFRGSKELIRGRLSVYLPLIGQIENSQPNSRKAVDLGSGRGEWLELLAGHGWEAIGVDPNASMAASAQEAGIATIAEDALAFLQNQEDESFGLVTAFHMVEHVETEYLLSLLKEINRVLIPNGVVILETPNPENLTVASWSFHMDPTHSKPIPPLLLQYYVTAAGFEEAPVVRLNGERAPVKLDALGTVISVLFSESRDYAVIATKKSKCTIAENIKEFSNKNSQSPPSDIASLMHISREHYEEYKSFATRIEDISKIHDDTAKKFTIAQKELSKLIENNESNEQKINELSSSLDEMRNTAVFKILDWFQRKFKFTN